jgi:integrase
MAEVRKRGRNWFYRYIDSDGRRVERKGCPDKRVTEGLASQAEAEVARVRAGLVDPKTDAYRRHEVRPLSAHLDDFRADLTGKGNVPRYVQQVQSNVARVLSTGGMSRLSDLSPARVQAALSKLRDTGLSLQTINHSLRHIKGFSRWLHRDSRVREDNLAHLKGFNVATDRRHDRGVLTAEEFAALLIATRAARPFRGLTGEDRVMLYVVASYTGLRASELASLTPASFDLERLTVRVLAGYTKNREAAELPLRTDLAVMLRSYLAGRAVDAPVWPGTWAEKGAKMLRADLEQAGVPYVDEDGHYRDFHSLRHRFGTELAAANVAPKVAQTLMRHSTITLTLDRYTHVGLFDTAGALDRLPPIPGRSPGSEPAAMLATGTDGPTYQKTLAPSLPHEGDGSGRDLTASDVMEGPTPGASMNHNPLQVTGFDAQGQDLTASGGSTPGRTRTCNPQFRRLMLYPIELRVRRVTPSRGLGPCLRRLQPGLHLGLLPEGEGEIPPSVNPVGSGARRPPRPPAPGPDPGACGPRRGAGRAPA